MLLRKIDKNEWLWNLGKYCNNNIILLLFALLIFCGAQVFNMPVITMYRFGIYLAAFLLGYFVLSHDNVQELLENIGVPMLVISVLMGSAYVLFYFGENYTNENVLKSLFTNVYAWFMTIAILGCAKKWFYRQNTFSTYMTKASYGFYVLHYTFVLIPCYFLKNYTSFSPWIIYVIVLFIVFLGTPVLYELISRIPVARYFILGIRKKI